MERLDGKTLRGMLVSAANNITNHQAEIDALNVFPVPDGDTGTNMSMTFNNGVKGVLDSGNDELSVVAKTLSKGLLMGARGNSGVILSQIFRGFYQSIDSKNSLTVQEFADALLNGSRVAYKAVMRPVEGTILTVIRESADYGVHYMQEHPDCSLEDFMSFYCVEAKKSLEYTPELLPVLKEVGVVDSGGAGLCTILEGFLAYLQGKPIEKQEASTTEKEEREYLGYKTQVVVQLDEEGQKTFNEERLSNSLSKLGDGVVVVQDHDKVRVRLHTLTPGDVLNKLQRLGTLDNVMIGEPTAEATKEAPAVPTNVAEKPQEEKEFALIAVAAGKGIENLFKEYRCDLIITGGQTMNPSTEDFVEAIHQLKAKHILILPNNSNIILAAQQAAALEEERDIQVLPTKSIPQGLSACIMFNPESSLEDNLAEMNEAIAHVKTGQVTYAIKDTTYDGLTIKEGDFMGIYEKDIVVTDKDMVEATKKLLDTMINEDAEIVTLLVGEGVTDEQTQIVTHHIDDMYGLEVDCQRGDQPVYSFIIGID